MKASTIPPATQKPGRFLRTGVLRYSAVELLAALLLLLVTYPFVEGTPRGRLIVTGLMSLVLFMAVLAVGARRRTLILGIVLGALAVGAQWVDHFGLDLVPPTVIIAIFVVFIVLVVAQLLLFILRAAIVNLEVLAAGISVYLLLAVIWSQLYTFTAHVIPNSFAFSQVSDSGPSMTGFTSLYFSLITICTVGYGDVVPASRVARMLAATEALTGMLFITVLMARLVALYSSRSAAANPDEKIV